MRRFLLGLLALSPLLHAPSSAAETPLRLSADAGVAVPLRPSVFEDLWQPGVAIGLGAERGIGGPAILWARLDYARFALDTAAADGAFYTYGPPAGVSGGALTIWGLGAGVRLRPERGVLRPYLDLGGGVRTIDADDVAVSFIDFSTSERRTYDVGFSRETKPAVAAGVGLLYAPRPALGFFLDARLDVMFTAGDETLFVPIRAGVLFR